MSSDLPSTFVQYVSREVVKLDEEFVAKVAKSLPVSDAVEDELLYFLAAKLVDQVPRIVP